MDQRELNFVNSRIRTFFLKHYEFRVFKKFLKRNGIDLSGKVILDAGCGSGYSTELIQKEFRPRELFAFDIMPEQIELAKTLGLNVNFNVGDATDIKFSSDKFDAVFIFDIFHHIPKWREALKEIGRVTKSGGVVLIEEPSIKALNDAERYFKIYHPKEAKFDWPEFIHGLEESGLNVVEFKKMYLSHFQSFMCKKT